ncbi:MULTISPECIES: GNAT family N-acetyltransferase [Stenotrophomonas]|uniref:GNAT family N-acetyltransferase n=1 Tax=Stenotrophomonas TaxID=40323 RepID=UPI000D53F685|nr:MULTISPECIES: GNAT family N-acetyltransferase [Stenotrophomonas]AWH21779.1 GNAT family N-acetyltransferase [Stenotrophomonas sp. ZAC14D2_NAIMI4_6]AWH25644.1 GNAT family N-acetyltransferase [Stenotrophomonas sp. YAU14D1_LEIMI4_1]
MNAASNCQFRDAVPTVEDYCQLRALAGLSAKTREAAERALPNTVFGVCAYQGSELVAMGRIIGDGGCHLQVCDIAVLPRLQGQGLGKQVMARLDDWMRANLPPSAYVSLLADGEAHRLYAQFGFAPTAPASIGMYRRF